jgi:hypothetical protein
MNPSQYPDDYCSRYSTNFVNTDTSGFNLTPLPMHRAHAEQARFEQMPPALMWHAEQASMQQTQPTEHAHMPQLHPTSILQVEPNTPRTGFQPVGTGTPEKNLISFADSFLVEENCKHGKPTSSCRNCNGKRRCPHNKLTYYCTQCEGGGICQHNNIKQSCLACIYKAQIAKMQSNVFGSVSQADIDIYQSALSQLCSHYRSRCPDCVSKLSKKDRASRQDILTAAAKAYKREKGALGKSTGEKEHALEYAYDEGEAPTEDGGFPGYYEIEPPAKRRKAD